MMPHGSPGASLTDSHTPKQAHPKPDKADWKAISVLHTAMLSVEGSPSPEWPFTKKHALRWLLHAIGHLSHPDRAVYPKTRKGTKGVPVVLAR